MNRGSSSSTTPTRLLRAGGSLAYHGDRSSRVYGDDDVERRERARGILREIRKTRRVRETAAAIDSRECVFAQEPRVDHRGDVDGADVEAFDEVVEAELREAVDVLRQLSRRL